MKKIGNHLSIRNFLSITLLVSTSLVLISCGGDSGANSDTTKSALLQNAEVYPTFDDLPNCTEKRQGDTSYVEADSSISVCLDERWQRLGKLVETEEDLQNCTDKREGLLAYVQEFQKTYECTGKNWVEKAIKDSSDKNNEKDDDEKNDGEKNDGEIKSSSSGKGKSSSSGSNSNNEKPESSSSGIASNPYEYMSVGICSINSDSTTDRSGPKTSWGYFGFVIPFIVKDSKTQKIFLKIPVDNDIAGPGWKSWSVLIAQYEKGAWVQGSQIFSNNVFNSKFDKSTSFVYTEGWNEIDFDIKATWLADESLIGKKVYVAINFFSPDVPSDSSGTGYDFYSVPELVHHGNEYAPYIFYYQPPSADCEGSFVDSRNNKTYKTLTIDSMTVITEMMKYDYGDYEPGEEGNLYTWETAMKVCPSGWRLPTKTELLSSLSNLSNAFRFYNPSSIDFWTSSRIERTIESVDSVYTYYVDSAYTYNSLNSSYTYYNQSKGVPIDSLRGAFCVEGTVDSRYPSMEEVVKVDEVITSSTFTLTLQNEKKKVAFAFSEHVYYHPVKLSSGTSITVNGTEYSSENCRYACTFEPEMFMHKIVEFEANGNCTITSSMTTCE